MVAMAALQVFVVKMFFTGGRKGELHNNDLPKPDYHTNLIQGTSDRIDECVYEYTRRVPSNTNALKVHVITSIYVRLPHSLSIVDDHVLIADHHPHLTLDHEVVVVRSQS